MKNYYAMTTINPIQVIEETGTTLVVSEMNKTLMYCFNVYELLPKQDAKIDKAMFNGQWYKLVSFTFLDLTGSSQKLLASDHTTSFNDAYENGKTLVA